MGGVVRAGGTVTAQCHGTFKLQCNFERAAHCQWHAPAAAAALRAAASLGLKPNLQAR